VIAPATTSAIRSQPQLEDTSPRHATTPAPLPTTHRERQLESPPATIVAKPREETINVITKRTIDRVQMIDDAQAPSESVEEARPRETVNARRETQPPVYEREREVRELRSETHILDEEPARDRDLPQPDQRVVALESAAEPPAPIIRVSIGRVEVRAAAPPPPPAPPPGPRISLDDYLSAHNRRSS
jgi:hypothetical protein